MICLYDLKYSLRTNINRTLAMADVNKVQKLALIVITFLKKILTTNSDISKCQQLIFFVELSEPHIGNSELFEGLPFDKISNLN